MNRLSIYKEISVYVQANRTSMNKKVSDFVQANRASMNKKGVSPKTQLQAYSLKRIIS